MGELCLRGPRHPLLVDQDQKKDRSFMTWQTKQIRRSGEYGSRKFQHWPRERRKPAAQTLPAFEELEQVHRAPGPFKGFRCMGCGIEIPKLRLCAYQIDYTAWEAWCDGCWTPARQHVHIPMLIAAWTAK